VPARESAVFDLGSLKRPTTPEEAVRDLLDTDGTGLYLAGGTILVPTGSPSLDYLVDLTRLGLDHIRIDGGNLVIGAMVRVADLLGSDELSGSSLNAIRDAARTVGTHTVRNRATVGGNVFAAHFPSDLPTVFLALGATLRLHGEDGPRDVSLEDFYARRSEVYRRGDLIVEVRVASGHERFSVAFEKTGRTRVDVAIVNCAAAIAVDDGVIDEARVVLNGVSAAPFIVSEAGAFLAGKAVSDEVFGEAGRLVSEGISARADHRASAEYRGKLAGVLTTRALSVAAGIA
jgi:carbon-monoxide dehydrogenase medium subunit